MTSRSLHEMTVESGTAARLLVCGGERCQEAAGARVATTLSVELARRGLKRIEVSTRGCGGFCSAAPIVVVQPRGLVYARVRPQDVPELIDQTLVRDGVLERLVWRDPPDVQSLVELRDTPFFAKQHRIALANCGVIDPESIEEYIAKDGYQGLRKALVEMSALDVIREMKDSGLRGRGGAGFLTGAKWEFCRKASGDPKYVVCNADEGDPGAFMDRSILESDPHAVIEGMAIAGYAIGAKQGYIYCREEYPLAIARLLEAMEQAREYGVLGEGILGTGFSFDIALKEGAGAFVCGEETALLASIEGRRGEPRPRPPFPVVSGLWSQPTNINNVKSYAMAARILLRGAKAFASVGTPKSPGTAIFALTGKIENTGLVEVPMGIPLGDIVFDIGGGLPRGKHFKAVQTGGPLGGCLPATSLNTPVDFDSLQEAGAVMGSGGMIVVDDDTCMVEFARYFLTFAAAESCGKCVPCRVGGQRLLEVLGRIGDGQGKREDLETIAYLSEHMTGSSLCGLGQRTAGPVLSALRFFKQEFLTHIDHGICPSGQCKKLVRARCINTCPAGVDTPAYLALVAEGRFAEGLEIHRQRNPFPMICGRACPAFCETKCRRAEIDEAIAIRQIKRFMADHEHGEPWMAPPIGSPEERAWASKRKVAVVGAGPAGLTAGLRLAQMGYRVTVFERLPTPGGMMTWAIPAYRLPRELTFAEIDNIRHAGVEIRCNVELGRDFTVDSLLGEGWSAVVLAIGAHKSRRMGIAGERLAGVMNGLDFLRAVADDPDHPAPEYDLRNKRVGVVGGGDVAIDSARTALRMGAREVHVMYRRAGDDMPATHLPEEIEGALHEGVHIHTLVNPVEVLGKDRVTGVRLQRQGLGDFDGSARRKPVAQESDSYTLNLDALIPAIGQTPDPAALDAAGVKYDARGATVEVDESMSTNRPGVFAAGDAVSGPATIVQAVAAGNQVAVVVDQWVRTGQLARPRFVTERRDVACGHRLEDFAEAHRPESRRLPVDQRQCNFKEVELGFDERTARFEARRCLRCDLEWLDLMQLPRPTAAPADAATEETPATSQGGAA